MAASIIRRLLWTIVMGSWIFTSVAPRAQEGAILRDPSRHRVRMVTVDANVQVEVLAR